MNLDELRAVQDREREKDSLQHLRDSFYAEVGQYIGDLRAERERQADRAEDPFADAEVRRLTDEIETAEEVAESIYERRMGKVVKTASLAAAGYRAETEGLTEEEADLFEDLVDRIEDNQATVLDVLAGHETGDRPGDATVPMEPQAGDGAPGGALPNDAGTSQDAGSGADGADDASESAREASADETTDDADDSGDRPPAEALAATAPGDAGNGDSDAAAEPGEGDGPGPGGAGPGTDGDGSGGTGGDGPGGTDGAGPGGTGPGGTDGDLATDAATAMGDPDRVTVRITADVGEIVGVDGTAYDLQADDVVTLPEENAMPLVEKDAATHVE